VKRYGDKALEESSTRVDELTAAGDHDGADTWRRISAAVAQLATMSVIWDNSENIYSVRVLLLVTRTRHSIMGSGVPSAPLFLTLVFR
jgi:hypothetical protein